MRIDVNIEGTNVPIEIDELTVGKIKDQLQQEIIDQVIRHHIYDFYELTEEEIDIICKDSPYHTLYTFDQFIDDLLSGTFVKALDVEAEKAISNRARYYRITMTFTQDFDIYVKAPSAEAAEEYASNLTEYDLEDYIDPAEGETSVGYTYPNGHEDCPVNDFFVCDD